jgi:HlyD family secretion protein
LFFFHRHSYSVICVIAPAVLLSGCSGSKTVGYQGYVEGDYVNVASPLAGRLEKLLVQRGQTVEAKAPLFALDIEQELSAKQQADEQLNAAQAQLADLNVGRRKPEVAVSQAQLAQARAALVQATLQLEREEAQFDAGGIPRGQLEDSRANQTIKAARVRELEGQLDVTRLPGRERPDPRPEGPGGGGARRAEPGGLAAGPEAAAAGQAGTGLRHALPRRRVGGRR